MLSLWRALVLVLPLASSALMAQDAGQLTRDTVLARVGATDITLGHALVRAKQLPESYLKLSSDRLLPSLVDQLVDEELLAQETRRGSGIPTSVQLELENAERSLLSRASLGPLLRGQITEKEIQAEYTRLYADNPDVEYHASHILLRGREEADEVVSALRQGRSFQSLARTRSVDPSRNNGGSLGWFASESMVPAFSDALKELNPGQFSEPVQTPFGWHVIQLNDLRFKPIPSLNEVRSSLIARLTDAKVLGKLEALRQQTDVSVLADAVPADAIRRFDLIED